MKIALINTNRIKPPIAPIGLEYIAEALISSGFQTEILDLCWEENIHTAIDDFFSNFSYDLIGMTLRNTDDCAFTSRQSFIEDYVEIIYKVREKSDAPIVLGGVGFSTMPKRIIEYCDADLGIWGEGEFAFPELAKRIVYRHDWTDIPNLIWKDKKRIHSNSPLFPSLSALPLMRRSHINNVRYFNEGGQIGIETKRGCPQQCIYCADPVAKGSEVRTRSPKGVVDEMTWLFKQDIDHFHTCDSEFNIPEWHAKEICKEIIKRNLGNKIRWYAYCSPKPFSRELASLMAEAGCVGINFGVDHGDSNMLKRLKRCFNPEDIITVTKWCKEFGITVMLDLLLGSPGESKESIVNTIELMKKSKADRIGIALGVRIYPHTKLEMIVSQPEFENGLIGGQTPIDPLFFIEPEIAPIASGFINKQIGYDDRFLFFNPKNQSKNYNYNANQILVEAIQKGYRGAYWDILRKLEENC